MSTLDIARAIKQFIRAELAPDLGTTELGDEDSLLDSGILDSMGILRLLSFVEERFQVRIPVEQVEPQNFESVTTISTLIASAHPQS